MRKLILLLPAVAAALMGSVSADSVTLKSGEKIEGKIIADTAESVTIQYSVSETIRDERVISREEIDKVEKTQADEILYQQIKGVKPDPMNSFALDTYDGMVKTLKGFLDKYPSSPHAAELQANIDALNAEKGRVDAGSVKYLGAWLSTGEAGRRKIQIEGQQNFAIMKNLAARGDLVGALNIFALIEKNYAGARPYPQAIELARQLVAAVQKDAERRQRTMKAEEVDYQKRAALTAEPGKSQLLAARKREGDQADAELAAAEKAGVKWKPLLSRSAKSVETALRDTASEGTRLAGLPVAAMRASLDITDQAKAAITHHDYTAAEKQLRDALTKWTTNEEAQYWTKELAALKTAAAATPPPAETTAAATPLGSPTLAASSPPPAATAPAASPVGSKPHTAAATPVNRVTTTPIPAPLAAAPDKPFLMTIPGALTMVGAIVALLAAINIFNRIKSGRKDGSE